MPGKCCTLSPANGSGLVLSAELDCCSGAAVTYSCKWLDQKDGYISLVTEDG